MTRGNRPKPLLADSTRKSGERPAHITVTNRGVGKAVGYFTKPSDKHER